MKTTMKFAAIISIFTMTLVTTSWASPRSKLSYEPDGKSHPSNYGSRSGHTHVWFQNVGPASKL